MLNYYEIVPEDYNKELDAYFKRECVKKPARSIYDFSEGTYYCIPKSVLVERLNSPCDGEPYPDWMYDEVENYGRKCIAPNGEEYVFDSFVVSFIDYYYRLINHKGEVHLVSAVCSPEFID